MFNFKVAADGDIELDDQGQIVMVDEDDELEQSVRLLLGTNQGEWFLNSIHGLAYKYLQVQSPDPERIRSEVLQTLSQEPRIAKVEEIQVEFLYRERKLKISFRAIAQDGSEIQFEEVVG